MLTIPKGYLLLFLHAHLPFVRHPEYEEFLEEDWLFEALDETYFPILRMLDGLDRDDVPFSLSISLTPPLCEMLVDSLLLERYEQHIEKQERLIAQEEERNRGSAFAPVVALYKDHYKTIRVLKDRWATPLAGFRHFMERGFLEIVTCPGTHPVLPFCATEKGRLAHLRMAVKNYEKHFCTKPRGLWLAECAYVPGLEDLLEDVGIEYFFMETHGVLYATPRPDLGVYAPIYCPNGVAVFGRDVETSQQVWSADSGYPGDPSYREFYRDLGFDAEYAHIKPFLHQDGIRRNVGLKYHRITGAVPLHEKKIYDPAGARATADRHAGNFMFNRQAQVKHLVSRLGHAPVITAPYDAELFGHWWFEGPIFLEMLLRKMAYDQDEIKTISAPQYLERFPEHQIVKPTASSWGAGGHLDVWLNERNDWIYRHLHKAEERMVEQARLHPEATGLLQRALNQSARELMLAQSSDWAFIMNAGTMVEYAEKRTRDHIHNLNGLYLQIVEDRLEDGWVSELEARNTIFHEMNYRIYL